MYQHSRGTFTSPTRSAGGTVSSATSAPLTRCAMCPRACASTDIITVVVAGFGQALVMVVMSLAHGVNVFLARLLWSSEVFLTSLLLAKSRPDSTQSEPYLPVFVGEFDAFLTILRRHAYLHALPAGFNVPPSRNLWLGLVQPTRPLCRSLGSRRHSSCWTLKRGKRRR